MDPSLVIQIISSSVTIGTVVAVVTWQFGKLSERIARLEQALHDTRGRHMTLLQDRIECVSTEVKDSIDAHERRYHMGTRANG